MFSDYFKRNILFIIKWVGLFGITLLLAVAVLVQLGTPKILTVIIGGLVACMVCLAVDYFFPEQKGK